MNIKRIDGEFSVCKVAEYSPADMAGEFCFIGKTDEENSLVCRTEAVPSCVLQCEHGWKAFRLEGTLDFSLLGILAEIATLLARAGIPIFVVSTYNTDYVFIKKERFAAALDALAKAGYQIV